MKNLCLVIFFLTVHLACEKPRNEQKRTSETSNTTNKIIKKQYSYVSIKIGANTTVVSDVVEIFSDISEDERFKLMDTWTKKLGVQTFTSRDLLIFNSYAEASADREMIMIASTIKPEIAQYSPPVYDAPITSPYSHEEALRNLNTIAVSHCTMQGSKQISFNKGSGMFSFGNSSFNINEVYAVYEYKPDNYYSTHWLAFNCRSGDCIPEDRMMVSGTAFAFDSRSSVENFVNEFSLLQ